MKDGKDIADFAVDYGTKKGANYIEARYVDSRDEGYTTRNGALIGGGIVNTQGIAIRVLADGGIGFCSTAKLEKDHVKKAIELAIKMAKASKRKEPIIFSEEDVVKTKWSTPVKQNIADISDEEKIKFVYDLDKTLVSQDYGESLVTRTLMLNLNDVKKYIHNSEGSQIESEKSLIFFYTFNTAKGTLGTEQRFNGMGGSMGWEWFEEENIVEKVICKRDETWSD
ncbi:MAG: hypothetical protein GNW80_04710 [Asgard group archaeon]|nr:hypothetical protein [Asgard group archaeon]